MYPEEERRSASPVQDRPTENGIKINNIISALILGVMGWVGVNIEVMKKDISIMTTNVRVVEERVTHIEDDIENHHDRLTILESHHVR